MLHEVCLGDVVPTREGPLPRTNLLRVFHWVFVRGQTWPEATPSVRWESRESYFSRGSAGLGSVRDTRGWVYPSSGNAIHSCVSSLTIPSRIAGGYSVRSVKPRATSPVFYRAVNDFCTKKSAAAAVMTRVSMGPPTVANLGSNLIWSMVARIRCREKSTPS